MEKPEFALSYDRDLGRPNWVSWHLSDEWIGSLTRVDTFRADPAVPPDWYRVQSFDFSNSGFDRGHMVPNADRDKETSIPINQATFLMSNMIAQAPDNNQGPWAALENYLRTLIAGNEAVHCRRRGRHWRYRQQRRRNRNRRRRTRRRAVADLEGGAGDS